MEEAELWRPAVRGKAGENGFQETSEMRKEEMVHSLKCCKEVRLKPWIWQLGSHC